MFVRFFYLLRDAGVPVTPTAFLRLQEALSTGLISSLEDFYVGARAILVKSERYFDRYDRIFSHYFEGAELPDPTGIEVEEAIRVLLDEWLKSPARLAELLGVEEETFLEMTSEERFRLALERLQDFGASNSNSRWMGGKLNPQQLIQYFLELLKKQKGEHHGGGKWIGTQGFSPVGHSGRHPEGMRVGGVSRNKSAVKVAMDRRYKDYSQEGPLTQSQIGEALKRLRNLLPMGPKDQVNIDETIRSTMKNGGEIEIEFERSLRDRLKVLLMIDNGGWSMDPYVDVVQALFDHAGDRFKDLKIYYFHNTIYDMVWQDPSRVKKPKRIEEFGTLDRECRLIIVGDASMAPYELLSTDGSIHLEERFVTPSMDRLKFLAGQFPHAAWLNPTPGSEWQYVYTIRVIREVFPMFELTLDGLELAVAHLMSRN